MLTGAARIAIANECRILAKETEDLSMSRIEAVYRHGVFQPLEPVSLGEEQRVHLIFEPAGGDAAQTWLARLKETQAAIIERQGVLPDSAAEITADRAR
jgi:predicted DNA-binding antitoxin AbrB/MazE fold protein